MVLCHTKELLLSAKIESKDYTRDGLRNQIFLFVLTFRKSQISMTYYDAQTNSPKQAENGAYA